nr:reverse transcriptase domain-containing protein [Tanacetum cinerariifolium]
MRTPSSSNLPVVSPSNPSTSNPKRRNRRRSKQPFILEESPIDTMANQCTMAELLRAPTKGYAEAIVVPSILAEQFELKHKPPHSIHTWEDLVSKSINEFFPSLRTTNLRNEISNFQQRFDESFHEAWDRYKDLLRACRHHGFTELHQPNTFYNALNPANHDSLNAVAGGNLLERHTQDVLTIIENKSKCLAAGGNTFSELRDNIQGYVSAAVVNYNQRNLAYRPPGMANQIRPLGFAQPNVQNNQSRFSQPQGYNRGNNFNPKQSYQAPTQQNQIVPLNESKKVKRMNEANMKAMQTQINIVKNELRNEMKNSIQASLSNQTNEIKNMMASLFQMNTASTLGSGSLHSNNDLSEYTIKVPPPPVQKYKPPSQRDYVVHQRDPLHPNIPNPSRMLKQKQQEKDEVQIHKFWQMFKQLHINITLADALILMPKYQKMLKALLSNKEKLQELANIPLNENCSSVILKKLPEKLRDPEKFLILCGFNELKYKALGDLGASINMMSLSVWKMLGLSKLISTRMTLELANRAICTPAGIARDVFVPIGKFTFPADFVIVDYESDPKPSGNPTFSSHPELTSPEVKDDIFDQEGGNVLSEKLLDLDSTKDLHPPLHVNPLSGSTTYSSSPNQLLEEIVDELALITIPLKYDEDLQFDIEFDLKEIEFLLHQDIDSSLKDSIDQKIESDTENVYDDPFDSKGEKIKESKLLIDELDLPCDFLPSEYDSIFSEDFSRVDALPVTNNEDKIFNPCILIQENPFEIITRVVQDKKLAISNASLVIEDFDPPLYELPFLKEVPRSKMPLLFSSENKEKVFKPGIHTSENVHSSLITKLSHQGYKVFKINQIFKSPMKIFLFSCGKDTHILAVPCLFFYPLDQFKYGGIGSS